MRNDDTGKGLQAAAGKSAALEWRRDVPGPDNICIFKSLPLDISTCEGEMSLPFSDRSESQKARWFLYYFMLVSATNLPLGSEKCHKRAVHFTDGAKFF